MGTIEMEMLYILATEQSHASGQASQLTTVSLRRDETRRHPNDNDARVGFADILFHLADLFVGRGAVGFNRDIGHRGDMFSTLDVVRGEAPKRLHDVKLARPRHPPLPPAEKQMSDAAQVTEDHTEERTRMVLFSPYTYDVTIKAWRRFS